MTLTLEQRRGLPEALQVLLNEHPREAWEADPNFNGLISFWLDRHMMFRKLGTIMQDEARALLDNKADTDHFARAVSHYGGTFVNQLHGHHQMEDQHYFPVLMTRDSRIERGFEMLDAVTGLDGLLRRHLDDEEDLIVPVILKHGTEGLG